MRLDIKYTCPDINKEIGHIKDNIENGLDCMIRELSPYIPDNVVSELAIKWRTDIYNSIESSIETIRETNDDIRKQFEKQSVDLENELSEKDDRINELEDKIYELENND